MKLSIIIPVFNEEKTVAEVIMRAQDQDLDKWEKEIIVVDDGSTDQTPEKIKPFAGQIKLLKHSVNRGKGAAIQAGLKVATGDAVVIQDADLEYSPSDWPSLLIELDNPKVMAVYGSRNINPKRSGYFHCVLGVWFLTGLINLLFKARLTDIYTCYKLFRSSLIKELNLSSSGFEFEAEVTAKILKKGLLIKEAPINYYPRKFKEGKKIRFLDGLIGIWTIIKIKLAD